MTRKGVSFKEKKNPGDSKVKLVAATGRAISVEKKGRNAGNKFTKNTKLAIIKLPDFFLCSLKTVSYKVHWLILGYRVALNYNLLWLKWPPVWFIGQTVLQ